MTDHDWHFSLVLKLASSFLIDSAQIPYDVGTTAGPGPWKIKLNHHLNHEEENIMLISTSCTDGQKLNTDSIAQPTAISHTVCNK